MKTVLLMCALSMVACTTRPVQQSAVNPAEYLPPSDEQEITLHQPVPVYRAPRLLTPAERDARLFQEVKDEALRLQMVIETYGINSDAYRSLRRELCQVDVVIDSRGQHWFKPFCLPR
jgi:hypothetical protein